MQLDLRDCDEAVLVSGVHRRTLGNRLPSDPLIPIDRDLGAVSLRMLLASMSIPGGHTPTTVFRVILGDLVNDAEVAGDHVQVMLCDNLPIVGSFLCGLVAAIESRTGLPCRVVRYSQANEESIDENLRCSIDLEIQLDHALVRFKPFDGGNPRVWFAAVGYETSFCQLRARCGAKELRVYPLPSARAGATYWLVEHYSESRTRYCVFVSQSQDPVMVIEAGGVVQSTQAESDDASTNERHVFLLPEFEGKRQLSEFRAELLVVGYSPSALAEQIHQLSLPDSAQLVLDESRIPAARTHVATLRVKPFEYPHGRSIALRPLSDSLELRLPSVAAENGQIELLAGGNGCLRLRNLGTERVKVNLGHPAGIQVVDTVSVEPRSIVDIPFWVGSAGQYSIEASWIENGATSRGVVDVCVLQGASLVLENMESRCSEHTCLRPLKPDQLEIEVASVRSQVDIPSGSARLRFIGEPRVHELNHDIRAMDELVVVRWRTANTGVPFRTAVVLRIPGSEFANWIYHPDASVIDEVLILDENWIPSPRRPGSTWSLLLLSVGQEQGGVRVRVDGLQSRKVDACSEPCVEVVRLDSRPGVGSVVDLIRNGETRAIPNPFWIDPGAGTWIATRGDFSTITEGMLINRTDRLVKYTLNSRSTLMHEGEILPGQSIDLASLRIVHDLDFGVQPLSIHVFETANSVAEIHDIVLDVRQDRTLRPMDVPKCRNRLGQLLGVACALVLLLAALLFRSPSNLDQAIKIAKSNGGTLACLMELHEIPIDARGDVAKFRDASSDSGALDSLKVLSDYLHADTTVATLPTAQSSSVVWRGSLRLLALDRELIFKKKVAVTSQMKELAKKLVDEAPHGLPRTEFLAAEALWKWFR